MDDLAGWVCDSIDSRECISGGARFVPTVFSEAVNKHGRVDDEDDNDTGANSLMRVTR